MGNFDEGMFDQILGSFLVNTLPPKIFKPLALYEVKPSKTTFKVEAGILF